MHSTYSSIPNNRPPYLFFSEKIFDLEGASPTLMRNSTLIDLFIFKFWETIGKFVLYGILLECANNIFFERHGQAFECHLVKVNIVWFEKRIVFFILYLTLIDKFLSDFAEFSNPHPATLYQPYYYWAKSEKYFLDLVYVSYLTEIMNAEQ